MNFHMEILSIYELIMFSTIGLIIVSITALSYISYCVHSSINSPIIMMNLYS